MLQELKLHLNVGRDRICAALHFDPGIVVAILDGAQTKTLSARELSRMANLPISWSEQRALLGFQPA